MPKRSYTFYDTPSICQTTCFLDIGGYLFSIFYDALGACTYFMLVLNKEIKINVHMIKSITQRHYFTERHLLPIYVVVLLTYQHVQVVFIFLFFYQLFQFLLFYTYLIKPSIFFMTLFGFLDAEIDKQKVLSTLHCYPALHDKTFFFLLNVTRNEIFKNINS